MTKFLGVALAAGLALGATVARAGAGAWAESENAQARLVSAVESTGEASTIRVGLQIRLDAGWHTYWRTPGDAGLSPEFDWTGSRGIDAPLIRWPLPRRLVEGDLASFVYENEIVLPIDLRASAPGRPVAIRLKLVYGVCADICLPVEASLALDLSAGPGGVSPFAPLIERYALRVPRWDESAGLVILRAARGPGELVVEARSDKPFERPDLLIEGGGFGAGAPRVVLAPDRQGARFVVALPKRPVSGPLTLTLFDGVRATERTLEPQGN